MTVHPTEKTPVSLSPLAGTDVPHEDMRLDLLTILSMKLLHLHFNSGRIPCWFPNRAARDTVMPLDADPYLCGSSLEHSTKSQRVGPKHASERMSLGLNAHLGAVQALDEGVHRGLHLVAKVSTAGFATPGAVSALRSLHCCPQGSRGFARCCHYSSGPSANSERVEGVLDEVPGQRAAGRSLRSGLLAYVAAVDQNVGRLPEL